MITDMQRRAAVGRLERRVEATPAWPLLVAVLVVNVGAASALHPFITAAASDFPGVITAALWAAAFISPVIALARSVLFAALVWAVASLFGTAVDRRPAMLVALAAEVVLASSALFTAAVVWLRGRSAVTTPLDLQVPQGIDILFDVPAGWPAAVNQNLGIFQLLWMFVLYAGLRRVALLSRAPAAVGTAACWVTLAGAGIIRLAFV